MAKHFVSGPGSTAFLDRFTCNRLPKVGRINLTYALTDAGTLRTEYTIVRRREDDYYLISGGAWAAHDEDYLQKAAEDFTAAGGALVIVHDVTTQWGVFALAGTQSRALLGKLIRDAEPATALGNKRFPWLSARDIELMICPTPALRVASTGELGWELHHPIEVQNYLFDRLMEGGAEFGLRARRHPGAELAEAGKKLPSLRHRTWPRRHPAGSRARPLRRSHQGLSRPRGDGGDRPPLRLRHRPGRRSRRRRSVGTRGALPRRWQRQAHRAADPRWPSASRSAWAT